MLIGSIEMRHIADLICIDAKKPAFDLRFGALGAQRLENEYRYDQSLALHSRWQVRSLVGSVVKAGPKWLPLKRG